MSNKYEYLKKFVNNTNETGNKFYSLKEDEIKLAEKSLSIVFPDQLKDFYKEIGYGFLDTPHDLIEGQNFYNTNRINSPDMIEEILCEGQESGLISSDAYELLESGDIPFFEIGDSSSFLVMKANSDTPNTVWTDTGVKIEDSFEKFIWRLYYEDPGYYGQIIESYYKDK